MGASPPPLLPGVLQPPGPAPASPGHAKTLRYLAQGLCPRSVLSTGLLICCPQERRLSPRGHTHLLGQVLGTWKGPCPGSEGSGQASGSSTPRGLGIPSVSGGGGPRKVFPFQPPAVTRDPYPSPRVLPGPGTVVSGDLRAPFSDSNRHQHSRSPRPEQGPQRDFRGGTGESWHCIPSSPGQYPRRWIPRSSGRGKGLGAADTGLPPHTRGPAQPAPLHPSTSFAPAFSSSSPHTCPRWTAWCPPAAAQRGAGPGRSRPAPGKGRPRPEGCLPVRLATPGQVRPDRFPEPER